MVVAPVEPVVFQGGNAIEAFAERWPGDGAALEVPLAGSGGVEQDPGLGRRPRPAWQTPGSSTRLAAGLVAGETSAFAAVGAAGLVSAGFVSAGVAGSGQRVAAARRLRVSPSVSPFKKNSVSFAVDAADENAEGFAVGADRHQQRRAIHAVDDGDCFTSVSQG